MESRRPAGLTDSINNGTICMEKVHELIGRMKENQTDVRFSDLARVCVYFFGEPRQSGTSHLVFKTPWPGNPRVNIQNKRGTAKSYQIKQVLRAIEKLSDERSKEE